MALLLQAGPPGLYQAWLAVEEVPGAVDLLSRLDPTPPPAPDEIAAAISVVRRMHDAGLEHRDLNLGNLLLGETEEKTMRLKQFPPKKKLNVEGIVCMEDPLRCVMHLVFFFTVRFYFCVLSLSCSVSLFFLLFLPLFQREPPSPVFWSSASQWL